MLCRELSMRMTIDIDEALFVRAIRSSDEETAKEVTEAALRLLILQNPSSHERRVR